LWWVSDILRGMSLDGLVAQVGQVLGDARSLWCVVKGGLERRPGRPGLRWGSYGGVDTVWWQWMA